jgi:hypothetical protein
MIDMGPTNLLFSIVSPELLMPHICLKDRKIPPDLSCSPPLDPRNTESAHQLKSQRFFEASNFMATIAIAAIVIWWLK